VKLQKGPNASLSFTLYNDGTESLRYTVSANDYAGRTQVVELDGRKHTTIQWPALDGYYDVIITADTGTGWRQRYAGRVATATGN
jgi:phospholipase C